MAPPGPHAHRSGLGGELGMERRSEANAALYWQSTDRPHRAPLMDHLASFGEVKSLLELGSSSGPNLRLAAERFPAARLSGIDIDETAIAYGQARFDAAHPGRVRLQAGVSGRCCARFPIAPRTSYSAPTPSRTSRPASWARARRRAPRRLVLAEPQAVAGLPAGLAKDTPEWRDGFAGFLRGFGVGAAAMRVEDVDPATGFATLVVRTADVAPDVSIDRAL